MTSAIDTSKPLNAALPRQQLPLTKKLEELDKFGVSKWMKDTMDALEAVGRYQFAQNMALKENYKIVSKEFDLAHYMRKNEYVDLVSAISQEFEIPSHLKHYDIIGKAVQLLVGEYLKRPDIFSVVESGPDATNERLRVKTDLLHQFMMEEIQREITLKLQQQGIDPNKKDFKTEEEAQQYQQQVQEKYQELTPKNIEKYMRYDYRTSAEEWGQAVLSNDRKRFNFRELEKVEFTDMLIADRCFSHMYLTPTGYNLEYWNPLNVFFHQHPDLPHIEKGDYVGRVFYMNKSTVIDRFGWRMAEEQIKKLYPKDYRETQGNVYGEFFNATMYPFPAYRDYANVTTSIGFDPWNNTPVGNLPALGYEDLNTGFPNFQFATGDLVQVTEAYWRSQSRIGYLTIADPETGEASTQIVDESFNPKLFNIKEIKDTPLVNYNEDFPVNSVVWTWHTQIWQGCKINANFSQSTEDRDRNAIYFDVKPCPFQFKGDFTPFEPKLPVVGGIFNNRNAKSNSLVDLLKPYQIFYNALVNQAYGIAQRNNGKIAFLDVKLLSNFKDWGGEQALEKGLAIGRELGIVPLDTSVSNTGGSVQFNQTTVLDLGETEKAMQLLQMAAIIEEMGFKQIGITPQRQGQTQASETATGIQAAVMNSYAITEPYNENFYNYKRRKLTLLIDLAQYVASTKGDITLDYITSDLGNAFIKTTGTDLLLKNMGVNVDNAQETLQDLDLARRLAVENNTTNLPMSKLISIISLKNINAIQKALEQAEAEQQKEVQAQREHEQEMQQQQIKAQQEALDKAQAFEAEQNQLDREAKIQEASIKVMGFDTDTADNGMIDAIEQGKIAIEQSRLSHDQYISTLDNSHKFLESSRKHSLEKQKLSLQARDIKVKEEALRAKTQTEKIKQQTSREQNQNQLQLANKKHKTDMDVLKKESQLADKEAKNDEKLGKIKLDIAKVQLKNARTKPKPSK
jgi:hypothetical protein